MTLTISMERTEPRRIKSSHSLRRDFGYQKNHFVAFLVNLLSSPTKARKEERRKKDGKKDDSNLNEQPATRGTHIYFPRHLWWVFTSHQNRFTVSQAAVLDVLIEKDRR